jgi:hypothetical protein
MRRAWMAGVLLGISAVAASAAAVAFGAADPKAFVLQPSDLPGWVVKKTQTTPAAAGSGILGDYGVLYREPGVLKGLIQIDSKAALCGSAIVARRVLTVVYLRPHGYHRVVAGWRIGDESALFRQEKLGATGDRLIVYLVVWRSGAVVGAVFGGGIAGTFHVGDVLAVVRKQQARIAHLTH